MSRLQKLYDGLPVPLQHAAVSVSGAARNRARYGAEYWRHRGWLSAFDRLPYPQKQAFQDEELVAFLARAVQNSAFYRELYSGVDVAQVRGVDDLKQLPTVSKEMLRSHIRDVYAVSAKAAVTGHTGGTTGKSLIVRFTARDMQRKMAYIDHFKSRVGFENLKMRRASFNGQHIVPPGQAGGTHWRYNAPTRQMIFSSFHLSEKNLPNYVRGLQRFSPRAIDGYFTSMCAVAEYMDVNGLKLTQPPVGIFPTAETVTLEGRRLLERVFEAPVYNQYASSEGAPFITECRLGKLHVEMSSGIFESDLQDSGGVLVTSFITNGTPLVRYDIGDRITFGDEYSCACGIQSMIATELAGRTSEFLYRSDGAKINSVNLANLFRNMPNSIVNAQFIQREMGKVDLLLKVDSLRHGPAQDRALADEFRHKFDQDTEVRISHVDEIPRAASGKTRFIINHLA